MMKNKTNDQRHNADEPVVIFTRAGSAAYATIIPNKPDQASGTDRPKPAER